MPHDKSRKYHFFKDFQTVHLVAGRVAASRVSDSARTHESRTQWVWVSTLAALALMSASVEKFWRLGLGMSASAAIFLGLMSVSV
jgi:hypothetical protein